VCCGPGTLVFSLLWIGCLIGLPFQATYVNSDLLRLPPWSTLLHKPRVGSIVRDVAGISLFCSVFVASWAGPALLLVPPLVSSLVLFHHRQIVYSMA
jgi:hypothetical protein